MAEAKAPASHPTRREVTRSVAYAVPVIVTLAAKPAFAGSASGKGNEDDQGEDEQ